ncbi:unnamed protein product [Spirodela intermedia]|uniref:Uncharacterized protein n=1 Tax=Spirodela intermedia TaxID=51605 RepID=A0A7I8K7N5_SPIIN|nr:unnamed protein product [Spirodela intermedia]
MARMTKDWMEVGRVLGSFILRSAQQEEALHRIRWYYERRSISYCLLTSPPPHIQVATIFYQEIRSRPSILRHLKMRLRERLDYCPHEMFSAIYQEIVASRRKQEENQGLINDILVPKIIMENKLPRVHQDHHGSSITWPKTGTQRDLFNESSSATVTRYNRNTMTFGSLAAITRHR